MRGTRGPCLATARPAMHRQTAAASRAASLALSRGSDGPLGPATAPVVTSAFAIGPVPDGQPLRHASTGRVAAAPFVQNQSSDTSTIGSVRSSRLTPLLLARQSHSHAGVPARAKQSSRADAAHAWVLANAGADALVRQAAFTSAKWPACGSRPASTSGAEEASGRSDRDGSFHAKALARSTAIGLAPAYADVAC